jgi:sugar/nucleoside kinase (ribokinase family)
MTDEEALALQKKAHDLGAELVLVTNGSKGQKLWDGSSIHEGEVKMVQAVDTMGAGDSFFTAFVVQLMREGYRRGNVLSEECIRKAFSFAADFSAQTCLKDGAFGFGTRY